MLIEHLLKLELKIFGIFFKLLDFCQTTLKTNVADRTSVAYSRG